MKIDLNTCFSCSHSSLYSPKCLKVFENLFFVRPVHIETKPYPTMRSSQFIPEKKLPRCPSRRRQSSAALPPPPKYSMSLGGGSIPGMVAYDRRDGVQPGSDQSFNLGPTHPNGAIFSIPYLQYIKNKAASKAARRRSPSTSGLQGHQAPQITSLHNARIGCLPPFPHKTKRGGGAYVLSVYITVEHIRTLPPRRMHGRVHRRWPGSRP